MANVTVNELRLGNWIDYEGEALEVKSINGLNKTLYINEPIVLEDNLRLIITSASIKPIPITREIIEWLHFNKVDDYFYELYLSGDSWGEKMIVRISKNTIDGWASIRPQMAKPETGNYDVGIATSFHQMQNLYFIIKGEELLNPNVMLKRSKDSWVICKK